MANRLLALDQASVTSGWAYFEDNKLKKHGKFTTNEDDIGERLFFIKEKVLELIEKYDIEEIAFEDIQFQKSVNGVLMPENVKTFKMLAMVFGVIYELCTELKIPHEAVLASTWKSNLGIKGSKRDEQKRNAQKFIIQEYGIKPTQDECDAICIGTYITKNNIKIENDHDWSS